MLWIDRPDEADSVIREALQLFEEALAADPEKPSNKRQLSAALYAMGTVRDLQGNAGETLILFERSRKLREELYTASSDEKNAINLMLAEARVGNTEAAQRLIEELGALQNNDGERHLERARALAQLSRSAGESRQARLLEEALTALERAIVEGYSDPFRVSHEQDLDPLHGTARFEDVVARLESDRKRDEAEK